MLEKQEHQTARSSGRSAISFKRFSAHHDVEHFLGISSSEFFQGLPQLRQGKVIHKSMSPVPRAMAARRLGHGSPVTTTM